jgi:hypothetical protein
MATTSLKIDGNHLMFMTVTRPDGHCDVDVYLASEDFVPMGKPSLSAVKMTEEEYHKDLRRLASEQGHFVKDFSTNPEWNPGYLPPVEDAEIIEE